MKESPEPHNVAAVPSTKAQKVSAAEILKIVVDTTPHPDDFTDPSQKLRDLGVINNDQAAIHRAKIAKSMKEKNGAIDPNKITSGPSVTVADCTASVFENQDGV